MTREERSVFEGWAEVSAVTLLEQQAPTVVSSASTMGRMSASWVLDEIYEAELLERIRVVFDKISAFRYLPQGWDSYTAPQIDEATLAAAKRIIKLLWQSLRTVFSVPFVAPCSDGGVLLEWDLSAVEITVTVGRGGSPFEYLVVRTATDAILDEGTTSDLLTLVMRIVVHCI